MPLSDEWKAQLREYANRGPASNRGMFPCPDLLALLDEIEELKQEVAKMRLIIARMIDVDDRRISGRESQDWNDITDIARAALARGAEGEGKA